MFPPVEFAAEHFVVAAAVFDTYHVKTAAGFADFYFVSLFKLDRSLAIEC